MIRTKTVSLDVDLAERKDNKPKVQAWKNVPMIRAHSLRATVQELLNVAKNLDVVKIGIIGEPSTGKTTLSDSLGHLIHKMADFPISIKKFGQDEFLNLGETLASLSPTNYVLKFGDLSFLTEKKKLEEVKQIVTKIRHLEGGKDVRIFLIYDYHYTLGLDKYLRQANFRYFTSMGSSETDNMQKIVGTKYTSRIMDFQEKFVEMTTTGRCTFHLNAKTVFKYDYKNPFVPCLFYNNHRLRYIIFPTREWIDPYCSICAMADSDRDTDDFNLDRFIEDGGRKFNPKTFRQAVKAKLFTYGINTYMPTMARAIKYIDRALDTNNLDLETLAAKMDMKVRRTVLQNKFDFVAEKKSSE